MAVHAITSPALLELFKALGAPEHVVEFHLIAKLDAVVEVQVTYLPEVHLEALTKRFRLVEIEDSDADATAARV